MRELRLQGSGSGCLGIGQTQLRTAFLSPHVCLRPDAPAHVVYPQLTPAVGLDWTKITVVDDALHLVDDFPVLVDDFVPFGRRKLENRRPKWTVVDLKSTVVHLKPSTTRNFLTRSRALC